jgi:hypothetical protein
LRAASSADLGANEIGIGGGIEVVRLAAFLLQPVAQVGLEQACAHRSIQALHDLRRHAGGSGQAEPGRRHQFAVAAFCEGRHPRRA